jgi:hypothetical protein
MKFLFIRFDMKNRIEILLIKMGSINVLDIGPDFLCFGATVTFSSVLVSWYNGWGPTLGEL